MRSKVAHFVSLITFAEVSRIGSLRLEICVGGIVGFIVVTRFSP